jgi:hypothetical protein
MLSLPRAPSLIVPAGVFMLPVPAGHEVLHCPAFAFLVEHAATGRRVMFDLGLRKDIQ